ncbi:hypothetical protein ES702_02622 [subsurface metagenome]
MMMKKRTKKRTKKRINLTIDKKVANSLKKKGVNMSKTIRQLLKKIDNGYKPEELIDKNNDSKINKKGEQVD